MTARRTEAVRARARDALEGAARRLPAENAALGDLLEAAGRLALLEPGAAGPLVPPAVTARAREALRDGLGVDLVDAPSLGTLAFDVLAALDARTEDDDVLTDDARHLAAIGEALAARDRVELQRLGAEAVVGAPVPPDETLAAELDAFEALLRPELWRLTVTNAGRGDAVGWVPATARRRFWWRFEGVDIDPRAADALAGVASLVARFPEARAELEALVDAEAHLTRRSVEAEATADEHVAGAGDDTREAPPAGGAPVTSLWDWVAKKRAAHAEAADATDDRAPVAVAASGEAEELGLLERDDVELSFLPPATLVVDVVEDRVPGVLPVLVLPDGTTRELQPVEGALERFAVTLAPEDLQRAGTSLRVTLRTGSLTLNLPPEEG